MHAKHKHMHACTLYKVGGVSKELFVQLVAKTATALGWLCPSVFDNSLGYYKRHAVYQAFVLPILCYQIWY